MNHQKVGTVLVALCLLFAMPYCNAAEEITQPIVALLDLDGVFIDGVSRASEVVMEKWAPDKSFHELLQETEEEERNQLEDTLECLWDYYHGASSVRPRVAVESFLLAYFGTIAPPGSPIKTLMLELHGGIKYPVEQTDRTLHLLSQMRTALKEAGIEFHIGTASNICEQAQDALLEQPGFTLKEYMLTKLLEEKQIFPQDHAAIVQILQQERAPLSTYFEKEYAMYPNIIETASEPCLLQARKPNHAFFNCGLQAINTQREKRGESPLSWENFIFIDDGLLNVHTAKSCGIVHAYQAKNPMDAFDSVYHGLQTMLASNKTALQILNQTLAKS